ncbi:phage tail terminator-like protein [Tardiphaga sp.]|uniref:phage tail terminator-like protein n=1 Tax=Tardiphaga sp. TaxID=1926292 RepID=UPI002629298B|nr:phage tail terminator-like protein [Tardiphaga sp.]MDB5620514.1 hypothetical protein [Tardiphaga sp.]
MSEPVEVAIQKALTDRATAFAIAQGMAAAISYPNVVFTPPAAKTGTVYGKWLQVSFLPAPSFETGISFNSHNKHNGIFQVSVFHGIGAGEPAIARIAAAAIQFFPRGLQLPTESEPVRIDKQAYRGPMLKDDPWMMIPVSIPYQCFARP